MLDRESTGRYKRHNTPGDGTGLTKLPESEPEDILTDAKGGDPATIKYDPSWQQASRKD